MSRHPGARFSDPAELYDLIYHWKDYASESNRVRQLLDEMGIPSGAHVLEAACGTGAYMTHLRDHYRVSGFDLDPAMLRVARARLADSVGLFRADMVGLDLDQSPLKAGTPGQNAAVSADCCRVDALLVLFGGVGYLSPDQLEAAFSAWVRAVRPGGVILVEPWVSPEAFRPGEPHMATYETRFLKIARQCIPRREDNRSVLEFHWLVARPGFHVEHITTTETLWLHAPDTLERLLREAGLEVERTQNGFMVDKLMFQCRVK